MQQEKYLKHTDDTMYFLKTVSLAICVLCDRKNVFIKRVYTEGTVSIKQAV